MHTFSSGQIIVKSWKARTQQACRQLLLELMVFMVLKILSSVLASLSLSVLFQSSASFRLLWLTFLFAKYIGYFKLFFLPLLSPWEVLHGWLWQVAFCSFTQTIDTCEERTSVEELPQSDWPLACGTFSWLLIDGRGFTTLWLCCSWTQARTDEERLLSKLVVSSSPPWSAWVPALGFHLELFPCIPSLLDLMV